MPVPEFLRVALSGMPVQPLSYSVHPIPRLGRGVASVVVRPERPQAVSLPPPISIQAPRPRPALTQSSLLFQQDSFDVRDRYSNNSGLDWCIHDAQKNMQYPQWEDDLNTLDTDNWATLDVAHTYGFYYHKKRSHVAIIERPPMDNLHPFTPERTDLELPVEVAEWVLAEPSVAMLPAHQQTFTLEGTSQQANRNIISSERYTTPTPMSDRQTAYYTFGEEYFKVWGDEADKRAAGINIVDTAAVKRTVNDEGRKAQTEAEQNPYSPGYPTHGPAREEAERHQQMNEGELHTTPGLDDASTPIYAVDGGRWRIPNYHQFQMPPSATPHEYQTHMYSNIAPADNRDTRRCPECDASDLEDWGEHMKLHAQRKANPFNWLTCD